MERAAFRPTDTEVELARDIFSGLAKPGFYQGQPVQLQWISGSMELEGDIDSALRRRPWEAAPTVYALWEQIPEPREGERLWIVTGGPVFRIAGIAPEGALWRLDLIPE
jgi:hypothetical protein